MLHLHLCWSIFFAFFVLHRITVDSLGIFLGAPACANMGVSVSLGSVIYGPARGTLGLEDPSLELLGCHCTLPFSFGTTKRKSNTRHLNIYTVDLFPLALYLLFLSCSVWSCARRTTTVPTEHRRSPRLSSRQETRLIQNTIVGSQIPDELRTSGSIAPTPLLERGEGKSPGPLRRNYPPSRGIGKLDG